MVGVDLIGAAVATYRIKLKGKKWWWAHFPQHIGCDYGDCWENFSCH